MITIITGKPGTGKTYLMKMLLSTMKNSIVYDYHNEFSGHLVKTLPDFTERIIKGMYPTRVYMRNNNDLERSFYLISGISNITIAIDEFSLYKNQYDKVSILFDDVRGHFHLNQNYILSSQRISDIPRAIIAMSQLIITFRQTELNDLKILSSYNFPPEKVKNLPDRAYLTHKH